MRDVERSAGGNVSQPRRTHMGSLTVHVPISTLEAFQRVAQSQRKSESDLAREAFERMLTPNR
jgi:hypothetical protein